MKPIVAVIGRPNVGKSTLFNRLTKSRNALVHGLAGVTRDRKYGESEWQDQYFDLIDTGGLEWGDNVEQAKDESLKSIGVGIRKQVQVAIQEANLLLFVVDARSGLLPADHDVANILRCSDKPVVVVANKVDGAEQEGLIAEIYGLGMDPVITVSAEHGRGISDLLDLIIERLPPKPSQSERDDNRDATRVAVMGRPNVGKSTLVNTILGEERVLVGEHPGTTRDSIDTPLAIGDRKYVLIDTAGLRRRAKVRFNLERWSGLMTNRSIERADICVLMIDALVGATDQDTRIVRTVEEQGKGLIILLNKWDLVPKEEKLQRLKATKDKLYYLAHYPIISTSALLGHKIGKVLSLVDMVRSESLLRIQTGQLNRLVEEIQTAHHPSSYRGKPVKLYYATQVSVAPPTFAVFTNNPKGITPQYERYFIGKLRKELKFEGNPVRVFWRKREST